MRSADMLTGPLPLALVYVHLVEISLPSHTQLFAFWMSQTAYAVDVVCAIRALQMSYGFSTRLTHANKIPVFKVNK